MKTFYILDDPGRDKHFHLYLLSGLRKAGFEPLVVYFCGDPKSYLHQQGIPTHSLHLTPRTYKNFNPWPVLKMASLIKERQPAILHVQRHRPLVYTALALKILRRKIPLLYTIRLSRLVRTPARRLAFSFIKKQVSYVIAVSRGAADDFRKRTGFPDERLIVIPNGIDPEPYQLSLPRAEARERFSLPEGFLFGMVARFRKAKDHLGLLEAFARALPQMPEAFLVLAGDGPLEDTIRRRVRELQLADRVIFTGRLSPQEVPYLLRTLDVFVHPTFREGMPAAVLEAMAAGLPIIATEAEGIVDIFETERSFGKLLPCGDRDALASALSFFYSLPQERLREMGEEARKRLEEGFTREQMVARNVDLYRRALHEGENP
ncbi:MAG: glycosyltransferase [Thermodesulfobacteria bacterium]|nr:glycosyltransferase [Thermodesulfobacteriota bacterium]